MNNEMRTLYEYAGESIHYHYTGDKDLLEKIVSSMNKIEPFERPDMIVSLGDKVLAIEHFEFDASSFNKKGSLDKRKLAERNRDFDNAIRAGDFSIEPIISNMSVDCIYSSNYYIKNFKSVFENHLAKIEDYKRNLIGKNIAKNVDDIIVCFFIVDTTPLGCYYLEDGMPKSLCLFQISEYIDILAETNTVDCVFFGSYDGKKNSLSFMSNCPGSIESTKKHKIINFGVDEFFSFNPRETRFCVNIEE